MPTTEKGAPSAGATKIPASMAPRADTPAPTGSGSDQPSEVALRTDTPLSNETGKPATAEQLSREAGEPVVINEVTGRPQVVHDPLVPKEVRRGGHVKLSDDLIDTIHKHELHAVAFDRGYAIGEGGTRVLRERFRKAQAEDELIEGEEKTTAAAESTK